MNRLPVLCCCNPENELGTAPAGLALPTRRFVTPDGGTGTAYPSEGTDWSSIPGFEPHEEPVRGAKTWEKPKKRKRKKKKGR